MTWEKLPPVQPEKVHHGCSVCGGTEEIARLDSHLCVGFGTVQIMKGDRCLYDEGSGLGVGPESAGWDRFPTLLTFEMMAQADPDHDWRYIVFGPMRDMVYQRQGREKWVLVKSGPGFA